MPVYFFSVFRTGYASLRIQTVNPQTHFEIDEVLHLDTNFERNHRCSLR